MRGHATACVSINWPHQVWEKHLQGLKRWAWLPKFCRTFGFLQNFLQQVFYNAQPSTEPAYRTAKVPQNLDGPAICNANRGDSRESIRKKCDSSESPENCDSQFFVPRSAIRKKGIQFGNPETIRKNQAIRANLRIDSRESGHLSRRILGEEAGARTWLLRTGIFFLPKFPRGCLAIKALIHPETLPSRSFLVEEFWLWLFLRLI